MLTIAGLAVGALAAVGFIAWERRSARPLLDVSVFRHRAVSAGSLTLLLVFAVLMGMFLVVVQFLQAVLVTRENEGDGLVRGVAGNSLLHQPGQPDVEPRATGYAGAADHGALLLADLIRFHVAVRDHRGNFVVPVGSSPDLCAA